MTGHGHEAVEVQFAAQRPIGVIDVQRDAIDPEMIRPYAQIEFPIGSRKLIERITVVRGMAAQAIEHLDKRMRRRSILSQEHAGNHRVNVLLRHVDEFKIPPLKEAVLAYRDHDTWPAATSPADSLTPLPQISWLVCHQVYHNKNCARRFVTPDAVQITFYEFRLV